MFGFDQARWLKQEQEFPLVVMLISEIQTITLLFSRDFKFEQMLRNQP
jgi:hypothetical protein